MPFLNRFSNRLLLIKNYDHRIITNLSSYFLGGIGFGAGTNTALNSIIVDSSGNFYMCGTIDGDGCLILKLNSSGVIQWQKKLTDSTTTNGTSIAVDGSGNVYVCATYSYAGNDHIRIFKYNSSGTQVFKKGIYRGNNTSTVGQSIAVDSSGNIFICGYTDLNGYNFYIAKLNTSGVIQYQFNIGGASSFDLGYSIKLDSSGNFYVAGSCGDSSIFGPSIIKYNSAGVIQWQNRINTVSAVETNIAVDSSGNVYACYAAAPTSGTITSDYGIAKYDTSGNIQWQKRINSTTSTEEPYSIAVDSSGNVYVLGSTTINDASIDLFLIKLDTSGTLLWQRTLATSTFGTERGKEIFIDSSDNIFIVGNSGTSSIFAKIPNDGSKTGTYSMGGGTSLIYADPTSLTISGTLFATSSSYFSNAGPALTIFDSFENETTPTLSTIVVAI